MCLRRAPLRIFQVDEGCRRLQQLLDGGAFNGGSCPSGNCAGGHDGSTASGSAVGNGSSEAADCNLSAGVAGGDNPGSAARGSRSGSTSTVPWDELFQLLSDDRRLEEDPACLPDTGYGAEFEAAVSGIFVQVGGVPSCACSFMFLACSFRVFVWLLGLDDSAGWLVGGEWLAQVVSPVSIRQGLRPPCPTVPPCPLIPSCSPWKRGGAALERAARRAWLCGRTGEGSCGSDT